MAACGAAVGVALSAMGAALMRGAIAVGLATVLLASGTEVRGGCEIVVGFRARRRLVAALATEIGVAVAFALRPVFARAAFLALTSLTTRGQAGERQERRPREDRPQRESNRNADFRGQRRNEPTPRPEADNDLASTSDFRPARKQHSGQSNGNGASHEGGAHRGQRHAHGRPAGRHNEERNAQSEQRNGGNGRMRRRGNGGQRRERA